MSYCPLCAREAPRGVPHQCPPAWQARLASWDDAQPSLTFYANDRESVARALIDWCVLTFHLQEREYCYEVVMLLRRFGDSAWMAYPAIVDAAVDYADPPFAAAR